MRVFTEIKAPYSEMRVIGSLKENIILSNLDPDKRADFIEAVWNLQKNARKQNEHRPFNNYKIKKIKKEKPQ